MQKKQKKPKYENKALDAIRNKYDEQLFGMGITQLLDMGMEALKKLNLEAEKEKLRKNEKPGSIMTADFSCAILDCAQELTAFRPMQIMIYLNKAMYFDV